MKKVAIYLSLLVGISLILISCIKNEDVIFTGSAVELDAATWNANSVGVAYPILTRQPAVGRASSSSFASDSTITRRSGTIQLRVNLVGAQKTTDTEITYSIDQTATTAVVGTHYAVLPGKVIIPANSSFGIINLQILNPGSTTGSVDLVIKLTGGANVAVSPNYNMVGLRISQS